VTRDLEIQVVLSIARVGAATTREVADDIGADIRRVSEAVKRRRSAGVICSEGRPPLHHLTDDGYAWMARLPMPEPESVGDDATEPLEHLAWNRNDRGGKAPTKRSR
jgi:hypothetical protein